MPVIVSTADHDTRPAQTELLIAAIAGGELDGLPNYEIYTGLCARLRAMGLIPDEPNVQRIAVWLSDSP